MAGFRHRIRVRYSDCDPQGVLFNANYLTYFDIAITELWREALGSYAAMHELGADLVVAEATVHFQAPIAFDAEVDLVAAIARLGTTSITTELRIESADGELHAEGGLRHVVVHLGTAEKTAIPDSVRAALAPYLTD